MKLIRKRRNCYALFFAVSICLAMWFGAKFMATSAFAFGIISVASLIFLVRQSRLLYDAALIWDNRILAVPSAFISTVSGKGKNDTEETVVSTFGILIGSKIYQWGCDGIYGVRLNAIEIDRERMYLTFGDTAQTMRVELLHGMTQKHAVLDAAQKLLRETGVTADITGW
ncbi:hypothetical protein [Proteiniborus sp.]|uniref:hypothetical protein n=1 Tax=Proteiniborus sp. TaxID=2079015 RepID=UPI003318B961